MFRAFLWKMMLVIMVLLATHVHHHPVSSDGVFLSGDCPFCHVFSQPLVAPPAAYVLVLVWVAVVWVGRSHAPLVVARWGYFFARGPPGFAQQS